MLDVCVRRGKFLLLCESFKLDRLETVGKPKCRHVAVVVQLVREEVSSSAVGELTSIAIARKVRDSNSIDIHISGAVDVRSKRVVLAVGATTAAVGAMLVLSQSFAMASPPVVTGLPDDEPSQSAPTIVSGAWGTPDFFSDAEELSSLDEITNLAKLHSAIGSYRSGQFSVSVALPNGAVVPANMRIGDFTVAFRKSFFTASSLRSTESAAQSLLEQAREASLSYSTQYDAESDSIAVAGPLPSNLLDSLNSIPGVTAVDADPIEF